MAMKDKCERPDFTHEDLSFVSQANDLSAVENGPVHFAYETIESNCVTRVTDIKS